MSRSTEVAEAVGKEGATLEQRAERLRQVVATPSERDLAARELLEVEAQLAERTSAELTAEAEKRVLGIVRAFGGLTEPTKLDNTRLVEAARAFVDKAKKLDERFHQIVMLKHEA